MNKQYCDKCGAEIDGAGVERMFTVADVGPNKTALRMKTASAPSSYGYDLCIVCVSTALAIAADHERSRAKARKK